MAKQWSKEELHEILAHATPIVRQFLKGLAQKGTATSQDLGVPHMAPVIGLRYSKSRGKEPFYSMKKVKNRSTFTIDSKYKKPISDFLATFKEPPRPPAMPKRGPGRPRKIETSGMAPVGRTGRSAGRSNGSITLPGDALQNWSFWADLVSFANEAARRGTGLILETDGSNVMVKQAR